MPCTSINRRQFLFSSLAVAAQSKQPNIVIVLCDDLGYGDVGCYNKDSKIRTPAMNSLARDGMRFTDMHSGSAVCTPTRYGLLTGRYSWRTVMKSGVLNGYSPALIEPGRETIASLLQKRGYKTGGFGKWHLGLGTAAKADYTKELRPSPNDYGFDEYFGIPASLDMPPYVFFENRHVEEPPTVSLPDNGEVKRGPYWRGGPAAPSFKMDEVLPRIVQRACRFIETAAAPLFAYVPLPAPHTPWVPAKQYVGKSKAGLYGDFVEQVDASVGAILKALEASGKAGDTLVIVTSDNGTPWEPRDAREANGHMANLNWRGQKADIQEAGHRIPFLVRWPGQVRPGSVASGTACLTDLFATMAGVHGVRLTDAMGEDSFSLLPVFQGKQSTREATVHHSANGLFSIRRGKWKLIEGHGSGGFTAPATVATKPGEPPGELYNLETDPHEDQNLYVERPEVVKELQALLEKYRQTGHSRLFLP